MTPPTIWIDADALPGDIKEIIVRATLRRELTAKFVANKAIRLPRHPLLMAIQVPRGIDVADTLIAAEVRAGDLVISADVPLASLIVNKGATVIDPRGETLTAASIGERLSIRDFMADLRGAGERTAGPPPFDERAKQLFAAALDRFLTARLR
jgi:uncharacterized protein